MIQRGKKVNEEEKEEPIKYSTDRYNEWETMNTDTVWFDTAGCVGEEAKFGEFYSVGYANAMRIGPNVKRYRKTDEIKTW